MAGALPEHAWPHLALEGALPILGMPPVLVLGGAERLGGPVAQW